MLLLLAVAHCAYRVPAVQDAVGYCQGVVSQDETIGPAGQ